MKERKHARNEVRLELVEIDIEGTIEAKRCRDRRYDLGDKAVEVRERGLGNVQAVLADVVDRLIVDLGPGCQQVASLSVSDRGFTMKEQSECSSVVCVVRTEL